MESCNYQRKIPVKHTVDVFVGGAGPAGVTAAVAAARAGKSVFLAENNAAFGGLGTVGMVPAYMQITDGEHILCAGLGKEIIDRLYREDEVIDRLFRDEAKKYCRRTGIPREALKRVYDDMVTEAGIRYRFQTRVIDVEAAEGTVEHVILASKDGLYAVKAKVYIDCTGDGDLCAMAGADYRKGDENGASMPSTLCSYWTDIDWDKDTGEDQSDYLEKAFAEGMFRQEDRHLPGIWRVGRHEGGGNCGHAYGVDGTDSSQVSEALVMQRRIVPEYEKYYRKYVPGFEEASLAGTADMLGIRASRRIVGEYVLSLADYEKRAVFADEIGRYAYPIDIHPPMGAENFRKFSEEYNRKYRYAKGESYGIPYRCLIPKGFQNLLAAGRCVSCDHYVQASIRVMPGCYILGEAAGEAAALAADAGCRVNEIDVRRLQGRLKENGGFLPNYRGGAG